MLVCLKWAIPAPTHAPASSVDHTPNAKNCHYMKSRARNFSATIDHHSGFSMVDFTHAGAVTHFSQYFFEDPESGL